MIFPGWFGRGVLPALLFGACAAPDVTAPHRIPLFAGEESAGPLRRADIDIHETGPPSVPFLVDCTALPYAKGEEQRFCYEWGSWMTLQLDGGILIACNVGEFGGFVHWYDNEGNLVQTLVVDNPIIFLCDDQVLLCVTGLSHLSMSSGSIRAFRRASSGWVSLGVVELPREPRRMEVEDDGSLLFHLYRDGETLRYRSGRLSPMVEGVQPNKRYHRTSADGPALSDRSV